MLQGFRLAWHFHPIRPARSAPECRDWTSIEIDIMNLDVPKRRGQGQGPDSGITCRSLWSNTSPHSSVFPPSIVYYHSTSSYFIPVVHLQSISTLCEFQTWRKLYFGMLSRGRRRSRILSAHARKAHWVGMWLTCHTRAQLVSDRIHGHINGEKTDAKCHQSEGRMHRMRTAEAGSALPSPSVFLHAFRRG